MDALQISTSSNVRDCRSALLDCIHECDSNCVRMGCWCWLANGRFGRRQGAQTLAMLPIEAQLGAHVCLANGSSAAGKPLPRRSPRRKSTEVRYRFATHESSDVGISRDARQHSGRPTTTPRTAATETMRTQRSTPSSSPIYLEDRPQHHRSDRVGEEVGSVR